MNHKNFLYYTILTYFPICDFSFQVRFALMPPELMLDIAVGDEMQAGACEGGSALHIESSGSSSGATFHTVDLNAHYDRQLDNFPEGCQHNIKSLLTFGVDVVHSTTIMQRHLMPPLSTPGKSNKYSATAAKYFLRRLERVGLGSIETAGTKALRFRKRKWEDLGDEALEIVNACGITDSDYKKIKELSLSFFKKAKSAFFGRK